MLCPGCLAARTTHSFRLVVSVDYFPSPTSSWPVGQWERFCPHPAVEARKISPHLSLPLAHMHNRCVWRRAHMAGHLSDGAIRSMTLPSVLYEALRPRVGSHILHGLGARIYEYDWVRSGFIDTPLCRRHTTPPLSRTSWPSAPHAYGGCSSLLFADKAKPICEAQIGGELIKMHGHRARTCFMRHNGRKWVWKCGEKTGRGSPVSYTHLTLPTILLV